MPTIWFAPSNTNSRSLRERETEPVATSSSASSELAATRTSTLLGLLVEHPVVLNAVQLEAQARVPPLKPRDWQVWPPRSLPSQVSPASRTLYPHAVQPVQVE